MKKNEINKIVIEIDEVEFKEWIQQAWLHKHDGWNRDYWCDISDMSFWHTTETKSTSFENGESVVLIHHESGDNNYRYDCVCDSCSSHNSDCENSCEAWDDGEKDEEWEDFLFGCMENVGWVENTKNEIEDRLTEEGYLVEWV